MVDVHLDTASRSCWSVGQPAGPAGARRCGMRGRSLLATDNGVDPVHEDVGEPRKPRRSASSGVVTSRPTEPEAQLRLEGCKPHIDYPGVRTALEIQQLDVQVGSSGIRRGSAEAYPRPSSPPEGQRGSQDADRRSGHRAGVPAKTIRVLGGLHLLPQPPATLSHIGITNRDHRPAERSSRRAQAAALPRSDRAFSTSVTPANRLASTCPS